MAQTAPDYVQMNIKRKWRDRLDAIADFRGVSRTKVLDEIMEEFTTQEIRRIVELTKSDK